MPPSISSKFVVVAADAKGREDESCEQDNGDDEDEDDLADLVFFVFVVVVVVVIVRAEAVETLVAVSAVTAADAAAAAAAAALARASEVAADIMASTSDAMCFDASVRPGNPGTTAGHPSKRAASSRYI